MKSLQRKPNSPRALRSRTEDANGVGARLEPEVPPSGSLAKSLPDGAVTLTPNGTILHSNLSFAEMMETPFEQLIGKSFFAFVRIGSNQRFFEFLHNNDEKPRTAEISLTTSKGKEIEALLACNIFRVEKVKTFFLTICDLKSRKDIEDALLRSRQRLETVAELTNNAVWEWDSSTREMWRSDGFASLLGYPPDVVKNSPNWWKHAIHPDDRSPVSSALARLVKEQNGTIHQTYRVKKFDGSYAEVVDKAVAIWDDKTHATRVIGSIVDVTDQNRAAAAKQEVARRVLQAQEKERERVARDLHDGVSQLLASSNYRLHHVEEQLARGDKSLAEKVSEVRELVEKAHREIQLISRNLRPSELNDLGLNAALRALSGEFQKRTGLKTLLTAEDFQDLDPELELTVYRIIQEALNNVEKHADAKRVQIALKHGPDGIRLAIRDDGKGFDSANAKKRPEHGWGLENMRERAACFGGTVTIDSGPSHGTEIIVTFPIK